MRSAPSVLREMWMSVSSRSKRIVFFSGLSLLTSSVFFVDDGAIDLWFVDGFVGNRSQLLGILDSGNTLEEVFAVCLSDWGFVFQAQVIFQGFHVVCMSKTGFLADWDVSFSTFTSVQRPFKSLLYGQSRHGVVHLSNFVAYCMRWDYCRWDR